MAGTSHRGRRVGGCARHDEHQGNASQRRTRVARRPGGGGGGNGSGHGPSDVSTSVPLGCRPNLEPRRRCQPAVGRFNCHLAAVALSHVYPLGSRLTSAAALGGRLRRDRARAGVRHAGLRVRRGRHAQPGARVPRGLPGPWRAFEVIYAARPFPCTAAFRLFAEEGLSADVASSGGELHLALAGGFDPARIYMHGNNKSPAELDYALEAGVGHIVVDSFDEIERLRGRGQRVLVRVRPGIRPNTHSTSRPARRTPSSASASTSCRARWTPARPRASSCVGCMRTSAHRCSSWRPSSACRGALPSGDWPLLNLGGGLGIAYTADDHAAVDRGVRGRADARAPAGVTVLSSPGARLVGNAGVTLYTVGTVKGIPGSAPTCRWTGMSDNLRPMLYGARYEAEIADRFGGADLPARSPACTASRATSWSRRRCSTIRARATCS